VRHSGSVAWRPDHVVGHRHENIWTVPHRRSVLPARCVSRAG
jgi:hypothetical protein